MSDFDNWKEEQERIHNDYDAENAWNAGQQSQQTKIDELQKLRSLDEMAINQLAQANQVWRTKCDKLQARIDEITNHVGINFDEERDDDQHSYWSGYNQAMRELNDILKVESK